jgi:hypothetical protein
VKDIYLEQEFEVVSSVFLLTSWCLILLKTKIWKNNQFL